MDSIPSEENTVLLKPTTVKQPRKVVSKIALAITVVGVCLLVALSSTQAIEGRHPQAWHTHVKKLLRRKNSKPSSQNLQTVTMIYS